MERNSPKELIEIKRKTAQEFKIKRKIEQSAEKSNGDLEYEVPVSLITKLPRSKTVETREKDQPSCSKDLTPV